MMQNRPITKVGIDDISVYIPSLFLDIEDLALARDVDPNKLKKGLGLQAIAVPDASEDVVTMAAEALLDLVGKNDLKPEDIGRIYVGTESMVDGSKPIASYLLGILEKHYQKENIDISAMRHIDAVDMTFACIGAIDALQNSLDWVRLNPNQKAIVVSTDWAKYDLGSPGECTQGAGAFAVLVSQNPGILVIDNNWGISTKCEHDFYKPLRTEVQINDVISPNGVEGYKLGREVYRMHKDTPVYDGHFSNQCYTARMEEAFHHLQSKVEGGEDLLDSWKKMIFHLPYAYHARRMVTGIFMEQLKSKGEWEAFAEESGIEVDPQSSDELKIVLKAVSKTPRYRSFVERYIESGEKASSLVGNMYTGSIFLSLMSTLLTESDTDFTGNKFGFIAYGSGSKSKVFQGTVVPGYQNKMNRITLIEDLGKRIKIGISHYEYLHREKLLFNLDSKNRKVFQVTSGWTDTNRFARNYSVIS